MYSDIENEYLLKAIHHFKRRFIVISTDFKILATNCSVGGKTISEIRGHRCYEVFNGRSEICENCAAHESIETGEATFIPIQDNYAQGLKKVPCRYSYPVRSGESIEALVSMDFDLPSMERMPVAWAT